MRSVLSSTLVASLVVALPAGAQEAKPAAASAPLKTVWEGKKSGWDLATAEQRKEIFAFNEAYKAYLKVARSAYFSTREVTRQAKAAGFAEFTNAAQVKPGARLVVNSR
ncbi:MAG TPA: hypothetical protein PLD86_16640, partial [Vicinamibacteria bacterium]|nr:hypothetical protein [Vicinamibacteria bacterium]